MDGYALTVFANAAIPQKIALVILAAAVPAILVAAALELRRPGSGPWRGLIGAARQVGPLLGLFVGAVTSYHMGRTIQRVPFEPTAKQLAPGILEVSALVGLGALVGLLACAVLCLLGLARSNSRQAI
jgi:hypothetical protein